MQGPFYFITYALFDSMSTKARRSITGGGLAYCFILQPSLQLYNTLTLLTAQQHWEWVSARSTTQRISGLTCTMY